MKKFDVELTMPIKYIYKGIYAQNEDEAKQRVLNGCNGGHCARLTRVYDDYCIPPIEDRVSITAKEIKNENL